MSLLPACRTDLTVQGTVVSAQSLLSDCVDSAGRGCVAVTLVCVELMSCVRNLVISYGTHEPLQCWAIVWLCSQNKALYVQLKCVRGSILGKACISTMGRFYSAMICEVHAFFVTAVYG